jgi:hypothetical protein
MSRAKLSLKGPPGLKMLSVLFTHPDKCFLSEERLTKARYLNLKYAKCFVVDRESGPVAIVTLCTQAGVRFRCAEMEYVASDGSLQLMLESYLDGVYEGYTQQLPQRLIQS